MSSELMRRVNGDAPVQWRDRQLVRTAKAIKDEVSLAEFKAGGAMALAAQIMEGASNLEDYRRALSNGDQSKAALLAPFEAEAFNTARRIQRNLFTDWSL